MKKIFTLAALLISVVTVMAVMPSHDKSLDKLPAASRDFIHHYFAGDRVQSVSHVKSDHGDHFFVTFVNGDKVTFDGHSGNPVSIHLAEGAVPSKLMPDKVHDYLKKHYPGVSVTSLDHMKGGCRIGLSNGQSVCLDKEGKVMDKACSRDAKPCSDKM